MIYLFLEFALLLGSVFLYLKSPTYMDSAFIAFALIIATLSIFVFIKSRKNTPFNIGHILIFISGFCVVFYQHNIDYVLGLIDDTEPYVWYDTMVVCKAVCLADIALCSFFIGNFFYKIKPTYKDYGLIYFTKKKNALIVTFILYLVYLLFVNPRYLFGGYLIYDEGNVARVINTIILSSLIAVFVLYAIDFQKEKKCKRNDFFRYFKYPLFFASIYIVTILISGRRTEAVKVFFLLLVTYLYVYKISRKVIIKLLLVIIAMSFVFTLRSMTREISGNASLDSSIKTLKESGTIIPFTRDLAFNVSSLHIVMSYYPNKIDYNYGMTFFPGFLVLIPGTQQLFYNYFEVPLNLRSSDWITTTIASNESFGLGTSIVADTYISFGPIGVVIIFLILGSFISYIDNNTFIRKKTSPYFMALSFSVYISLIYACRGSVSYLFANLTYTWIFVWLFSHRIKCKS